MKREILIDKWRTINVEDTYWSESIIDDWVKEKLPQYGIYADKVHWSGFASQGDGACFVGTVDLNEFCLRHADTFPLLARWVRINGAALGVIRVTTSSRNYCHANTMRFESDNGFDEESFSDDIASDELTAAVAEKANWVSKAAAEYDALYLIVEEACKDSAREIYRELEVEFDYLTSDEVVWEAIEASELHLEELLEEGNDDE